MASTTSFLRSVARASLRSIPKPKSTPKSIPTASLRPPSLTRLPAELGCMSGSLLPLHSAVAAARLTSCLSTSSRSCRALSQGTLCRTSPSL